MQTAEIVVYQPLWKKRCVDCGVHVRRITVTPPRCSRCTLKKARAKNLERLSRERWAKTVR